MEETNGTTQTTDPAKDAATDENRQVQEAPQTLAGEGSLLKILDDLREVGNRMATVANNQAFWHAEIEAIIARYDQ